MRSVLVINEVKKGELFTDRNLGILRPNEGCHPKYYNRILGTKDNKNCYQFEPFLFEDDLLKIRIN